MLNRITTDERSVARDDQSLNKKPVTKSKILFFQTGE